MYKIVIRTMLPVTTATNKELFHQYMINSMIAIDIRNNEANKGTT